MPSPLSSESLYLPSDWQSAIKPIDALFQNPAAASILLPDYDINELIESTLRDNEGMPLRQAEIHLTIQDFIDECLAADERRMVISAPHSFGKSEQVAIARPLYEVGQNQNLRIKLVTNITRLARSRVRSLRRAIVGDDYQGYFPSVSPNREQWNNEALLVWRTSPGSDPTVEAFGVLSEAEGARCDWMIFDDPCDYDNSFASAVLREKVHESICQKWLNRVDPKGVVLIIRTIWHEEDAVEKLLRTGIYRHLRIALNSKKNGLDVSIDGKAQKPMTLWQERPREWLVQREQEIGELRFNRGYRQIAYSKEEMYFKHYEQCVEWGVKDPTLRWPPALLKTGVDLSTKVRRGTVIVVGGVAKTGEYVKYDQRILDDPNQLAPALLEMQKKWNSVEILVENNGMQNTLVDQLAEVEGGILPIKGIHTGKEKFHPELGLPQLDLQFWQNKWVLPMPHAERPLDCLCDACEFLRQLRGYPNVDADDCVMALWFVMKGLDLPAAAAWSPETPPPSARGRNPYIKRSPSFIRGNR